MKHRAFSLLRKRMTPARRKRNARAADNAIAEILLSELRQSSGLTQRKLAAALGIKQPTLAQMEKQTDIKVSTLRRLIEALGGELDLIVRLPTGEFRVTQF